MNKVTNDQISVLYNLLIDNGLILVEAYNDHILRIDGEFMNKMSQLVEFSKQIVVNAENDNIDFIDLNRLVLKLMFKAEEIHIQGIALVILISILFMIVLVKLL